MRARLAPLCRLTLLLLAVNVFVPMYFANSGSAAAAASLSLSLCVDELVCMLQACVRTLPNWFEPRCTTTMLPREWRVAEHGVPVELCRRRVGAGLRSEDHPGDAGEALPWLAV